MGISPWYVGQTAPTLSLAFTIDSGAPLSLAGATLKLIIHNTKTLTDQVGAGSFVITNQLGGLATYTVALADVLSAGFYQLIFTITVAGQTYICDPVPWNVLPI